MTAKDNNHKIVIEEPSPFYCQLDESNFYNGLKSIRSIRELYISETRNSFDERNKIALILESEYLPSADLKNLIGLLMRYELPMQMLAAQCNSHNRSWLKNPHAYWYQRIFDA